MMDTPTRNHHGPTATNGAITREVVLAPDFSEVQLANALASLPATGLAQADGRAAPPIRKLVLNDAGPVVSKVSLERIATYVGVAPGFATFEQAVQYVRTVSAPFGPR